MIDDGCSPTVTFRGSLDEAYIHLSSNLGDEELRLTTIIRFEMNGTEYCFELPPRDEGADREVSCVMCLDFMSFRLFPLSFQLYALNNSGTRI